jgi:hypothetical protein
VIGGPEKKGPRAARGLDHTGLENGRSAWVALCAHPTRTDTDHHMATERYADIHAFFLRNWTFDPSARPVQDSAVTELVKQHWVPVGTSHDIMQRKEMNGNPNSDVMCVYLLFLATFLLIF